MCRYKKQYFWLTNVKKIGYLLEFVSCLVNCFSFKIEFKLQIKTIRYFASWSNLVNDCFTLPDQTNSKKSIEVWNESSHNLLWMILVLRLRNLAFLSIAKALAVQGYCSIWWTGHWILLMAGKNDKICYICFMTSIHLRNKISFLKNCGLHKEKEILKDLNFCKKI